MSNTINDTNDLKDFLKVDISKEYNETVKETKQKPHAAVYTRKRPTEEEYFKVYDPSGKGDVESIPRRVTITIPVKGEKTTFLCLGPEDFQERVKEDFLKVKLIRPAMYETSGGRVDIWPVNEPIENKQGHVNAWTATANDILEKSLTRWVRIISNNKHGYYDGYFCNPEKEAALEEANRPFFKLDYDEVLIKAYQGFILTPKNYDTDPHVQDHIGYRMNTIIKDEKGKKIN